MAKQPKIQYINSYISGNAAYAFPQEEPLKKRRVRLPKPKPVQRYVIHLCPTAVLGIVLSVVLLVAVITGFFDLQGLGTQEAELEQYVSSLQTHQEQLKQEYAAGYDLEEVRKTALAMGMVPVEQLPHESIEVRVPVAPEEPTVWENIWTFLKGLFA